MEFRPNFAEMKTLLGEDKSTLADTFEGREGAGVLLKEVTVVFGRTSTSVVVNVLVALSIRTTGIQKSAVALYKFSPPFKLGRKKLEDSKK
jgi:hypothetical protein